MIGQSLLTTLGLLILVINPAPSLADAEQGAASNRPNFLFIITDDQRFDALGVVQREQGERARFPWFRTPNMDRLAKEGLRFRNAFVVNSLCSPSRANFLTGQYNHQNGVVNNHTPFPPENITHATLLRQSGYTTAYFGKWHCDGQKERPGFEQVASYVGQGRFIDCPFLVNGAQTPTTGWVDDVTTDFAIEFLKKQKDSDKPFNAVVGFKSPHGPRVPPERAAKRFAGEVARPVPNLDAAAPYRQVKEQPANRRQRAMAGAKGFLDYFRTVSAIDDCLGRLLDALDELKLADNTVVVFTSDNGYYLGEHGLSDKRSAYEESLRIPLLVRYPKRIKPGLTNDAMVLNIDYAPTVLQLAGVEVPKDMQGQSWLPLFEHRTDGWRESFVYEYFYENRYDIPTIVATRTATVKLIIYPGQEKWTELYDLSEDPYETKNLATDPAHAERLKRMRELHESELKRVGYHVPAYADKAPTAP